MHLSSKVSSVGIFTAASTILIFYLLSIRYNVSIHASIFWVAIGLILCTIVYQITQLELSSNFSKVILLEIATTCLIFHLIYQIPYYGLRGSDVYIDLSATKSILYSGHIRGASEYTVGPSYYPMIHILGTQLNLITDIDILWVAKWFPSLIDIGCILLLYLLIKNIFKRESVALLSILLFSVLQHHILFSSLFIRETYALVSAICCIYLYLSAKSSAHPITYYALAIVCLIVTVFAHHLTSFMLFLFLLIHFLVSKVSEVPFIHKKYFGYGITGEKITGSFVLIAFVSISTYWISTLLPEPVSPFSNLTEFVRVIFNPDLWRTGTYGEVTGIGTTTLPTIRGSIIYYGFFFFNLIFGVTLLYGLLPGRQSYRIEYLSSTIFLFCCALCGLIALYLVPIGILPYPDRFLMFGWLFAFGPLVLIILNINRKRFMNIGITLLVIFMLYNIYQIEQTTWLEGAEEVAAAATEEDYSLAKTLNFTSGGIATHRNNLYVIFDVYNILGEDAFHSDTGLSEYEWLVVHKEALRLEQEYYSRPRTEGIAEMVQLEEVGSLDRNRIYESDNLAVYRSSE